MLQSLWSEQLALRPTRTCKLWPAAVLPVPTSLKAAIRPRWRCQLAAAAPCNCVQAKPGQGPPSHGPPSRQVSDLDDLLGLGDLVEAVSAAPGPPSRAALLSIFECMLNNPRLLKCGATLSSRSIINAWSPPLGPAGLCARRDPGLHCVLMLHASLSGR